MQNKNDVIDPDGFIYTLEDCIDKIPNPDLIEEVRLKIINFDFNNSRGHAEYYDTLQYSNMLSHYTASEVFCAIIKHESEPVGINKDHIYVTLFNFQFSNNFFHIGSKDIINLEQVLINHKTLEICLQYCLLENTSARLNAFLYCLEKWSWILGIIPHFDEWCKKAISQNNQELLQFCVSYCNFLLKENEKDVIAHIINYYRKKTHAVFLQDIYELITSMPSITKLLKIKADLTLWQDTIINILFKNLPQLCGDSCDIDLIKKTLFLSKTFKKDFKDALYGGSLFNGAYKDENALILGSYLYHQEKDDNIKLEIYEQYFNILDSYCKQENIVINDYRDSNVFF